MFICLYVILGNKMVYRVKWIAKPLKLVISKLLRMQIEAYNSKATVCMYTIHSMQSVQYTITQLSIIKYSIPESISLIWTVFVQHDK